MLVFYVMGKVLTSKLSYLVTGLVPYVCKLITPLFTVIHRDKPTCSWLYVHKLFQLSATQIFQSKVSNVICQYITCVRTSQSLRCLTKCFGSGSVLQIDAKHGQRAATTVQHRKNSGSVLFIHTSS